jgi:hypothetical protein
MGATADGTLRMRRRSRLRELGCMPVVIIYAGLLRPSGASEVTANLSGVNV